MYRVWVKPVQEVRWGEGGKFRTRELHSTYSSCCAGSYTYNSFFLTNDWLEVSGHAFNTQELLARLQMLDLKVASRSVERTAFFSGQVNVIQLERLPLRVKVVRTNSCSYVVGQYSSWQHWSSSHLFSIGIAEIPTSSLVLFGRTLLPDCYQYYYLMM